MNSEWVALQTCENKKNLRASFELFYWQISKIHNIIRWASTQISSLPSFRVSIDSSQRADSNSTLKPMYLWFYEWLLSYNPKNDQKNYFDQWSKSLKVYVIAYQAYIRKNPKRGTQHPSLRASFHLVAWTNQSGRPRGA